MAKVKARVVISGLVQGVFFRAATCEQAINLGLAGWVKNRWDGKVEAIFEGEKSKVEQMVGWCHKGPAGSRVDRVGVSWEDCPEEFDSFFVKY